MRYRQLGTSGLTVSAVGLGCNAFGRSCDLRETQAVVRAALDNGVTFVDVADVYGDPAGTCEEYVGQALKRHRDAVVLATKFGNPPRLEESGASRRYVRRAVEASLRRLGTDRIDLYQLHSSDARTPIEETLAVLDDLIREGKIGYAGSSMFAEWEIVEADLRAQMAGLHRLVSTQAQYNLLWREPERELVRACSRHGVGVIPFFPLARGLLTGKYRRAGPAPTPSQLLKVGQAQLTAERLRLLETLEDFAGSRGIQLLDVALGWLASRPGVATVIAGATRPEQVAANVAAAEWEPTPEDLRVLDELVPPPEQRLHRQRPPWTR